MSLSLTSPVLGAESTPAVEATNTLHFAPFLIAHFWRWWELFDSSMSLPIRQGKLFPAAQEPSPKFGAHTATIKYRFDLAPLFIAHTYRQESEEDWRKGVTTILGVKGKIGTFKVDLHQRAEELTIKRPEIGDSRTAIHKKFYLAEVHCGEVDLRVISATYVDSEKATAAVAYGYDIVDDNESSERPENRLLDDAEEREWFDQNDFVDLGPSLQYDSSKAPDFVLVPLMTSPVCTYYRQSSSGRPDDSAASEEAKSQTSSQTKFGVEASHMCLIGQAPGQLVAISRRTAI